MPPFDWLSALDKQAWGPLATLTSASVGFGGVILTLFLTARRVRQDENRVTAEKALSLRRALGAELAAMIHLFSEELGYIVTNNFTWIPVVEIDLVYKKNLDAIGLLTGQEVKAVVAAYAGYYERLGYISKLQNPPETESRGMHIGVHLDRNDNREIVTDALQQIVELARQAAETLDTSS